MGQKSGPAKESAEQVVKEIRRATRRQFSAEEKIRIVLSGLRGEDSIAELGRRFLRSILARDRDPQRAHQCRVVFGRVEQQLCEPFRAKLQHILYRQRPRFGHQSLGTAAAQP